MTDTPLPISSPPSRLDVAAAFIGAVARPFAIISTAAAASAATVIISLKVDSFGEGAIFIGAVFAGVGALFGAKAWEVAKTGKQNAEVEIAKANAPTA